MENASSPTEIKVPYSGLWSQGARVENYGNVCVCVCVRERDRDREMVRVSEGGEETEMAFLGFKFCKMSKDFPGSPVAKTLGSQCRGPGFNLWSGN